METKIILLLLLKIMYRNDQDKNDYNKVYLFVHNKTVLLNSYIMNTPQIKHESKSTLLEILLVMVVGITTTCAISAYYH